MWHRLTGLPVYESYTRNVYELLNFQKIKGPTPLIRGKQSITWNIHIYHDLYKYGVNNYIVRLYRVVIVATNIATL